MTINKKVGLALLAVSLLQATPSYAKSAPLTPVTTVYVDDRPLELTAQPLLLDGTTLVPMRQLFEAQGAVLSWNGASKTVTATKNDTTLTYRIGEVAATLNDKTLSLNVPGQIIKGNTMIPLRFVSEALGSTVKWDALTRTIRIASKEDFFTTILSGVNLRSKPDSSEASPSLRLIPTGEKVHVIREVNALWLEVRTKNNLTGYISAKPKYSDYTSTSLAERQGDELIAYGQKFLGTPYEFGAATGQTATFDCSSFVGEVFRHTLSIDLPRVSYDQAKEGREVGLNELRKGDLLFFSARGLEIGHVAIYAGNNKLLHTFSKERGVHFDTFDDKWKKRFVTARRLF
ncbi:MULTISPECIES: stalk domain-containing protein [Paenibacillus]|uniref:Copper amine oxidase domain protein n=1 Tax=Paenibacillus polymyxa TaxID=1406 RepID=A0A378XWK0_PAEPO|nr:MULTISPECIES: stalk domain-containing protein [Paenibacillus]KAF6578786.1 C40 family peptidase [Paenibacillus sp. EKM211P]KKD56224.1 copper amine oxidase [Paenibacillus sp. ICGEB2008]MBE3648103.1 SH3 domain-containing protein [Paenibacillus polymyxa]MBE7898258.1 C40 family peptidase [Paenibacillus polymyxa]MBG9763434.1 copper amine oxidase [Paenibacillus polymyxa]